jgi:hypothetical protein
VYLGGLLAGFCIAKGYYVVDAETLIVLSTGLFSVSAFTATAEMVRKDTHASESAKWE